ncbi:helix-turn-helix domain-containing protein [Flavobacterium sp. SM2513]|uniref:helix-turn-helix domain-containing protein n=1 Tax=Flavobacterium sp. SM2513 TaxID=3424766 RepID=UPI003D7F1B5C
METIKNISIGKMIRKYIEENKLSRTKLAAKMGIPNTAFYSYEKQDSLQAANLMRICEAFQYNFFMDIANQLPETYAFDKTLRTSKDFIITEQEAEIQKLKLENNLMKELLIKRG